MIAALARALRLPVSSSTSLRLAGTAATSPPTGTSSGLIGLSDHVGDDAHVRVPDRHLELLGRARARPGGATYRSRRRTTSGSGRTTMRPDEGAADDRPLGEAGVGQPAVERLDRRLALLGRRAHLVAHGHDLVARHELARPVDRAQADQQDAQAHRHAQRQVQGPHGAERSAVRRRHPQGSARRPPPPPAAAATARPNSVATWRSARLAARGSTSVRRVCAVVGRDEVRLGGLGGVAHRRIPWLRSRWRRRP